MHTKYVVVLGSLLSGLGKGVITASIAKVFSFYGYKAMPLKFDGYLNYDCGTMNPFRHGEVFVLDDKSEVDMDFGTYERFLNKSMSNEFSITGGKLFSELISKERRGDFLGRDVQIVPHLTNLIIEKLKQTAKSSKVDVLLVEVGGTVGDLENNYFIEAMRQLALNEKVVFADVVYMPELSSVGEQKTKPTQLALRSLMSTGISPDFIITRSERPLNGATKEKLALFSNLTQDRIIDDYNIEDTYELPIRMMQQKLDKLLIGELGLGKRKIRKSAVESWQSYLKRAHDGKGELKVSIVGKYVGLHDSYASVIEATKHAAARAGVRLRLNWVESELLEGKQQKTEELLKGSDGIIVPGGFGERGIEGMINAISYARVKRVPFLGLCLGMQLMAMEYARNVCKLEHANSSEFNPGVKYKIIDIMEDQRSIKMKGGTMRLGAWPAKLRPNTFAYKAYGKGVVSERHRHRYELNNTYRKILEKSGLVISGTTPENSIVEIIEWKTHFGVGTQAHIELKSRPEAPAPLFVELVKNAQLRHQ